MSLHPLLIAPSILAADFASLRDEIARVEASADLLHLDIMDGHFVPNLSFGPFVVARIRQLTQLRLDVHLMISQPQAYLKAFAEAGADHITFHLEAPGDVGATLREIRARGCGAGLALKPNTPFELARAYLGKIDRLLIMTVEPGFGGQAFLPPMLEKVGAAAALRGEAALAFDIEVDGGLDRRTIGPAAAAGAEVIVAGTAIFGQPDAGAAIAALRAAARPS